MEGIKIARSIWPYISRHANLMYKSVALTVLIAILAQVYPLVTAFVLDEVKAIKSDGISFTSIATLVGKVIGIMVAKEIVSSLAQYFQRMTSDKLRLSIASDLHDAALSKVLNYPLIFFLRPENQAARLEKRMDKGVDSISKMVKNVFIDILPLFATAGFALGIMYTHSIAVGLIATALMPIYSIVSNKQGRMQRSIRLQIQELREKKSQMLISVLDALMVVRSFKRERYELKRQTDCVEALAYSERSHNKGNYLFDCLKTGVEQLGVAAILLTTACLVFSDKAEQSAILLNLMLFANVSAPVKHLHRIYDEYNEALVHSAALFELLSGNEPATVEKSAEERFVQGDIELRGVDLVYPNGFKALHAVSVTLKRGKVTAFVGLSGAGKSSAMNVLAGFIDPSAGGLFIDGHPVCDIGVENYRDELGMVLQHNHIFAGTIDDNIRYGKLDATDEEIKQAAKRACLDDQIHCLPRHYKSDASLLSGGQKQRLAIARLFLKDPSIIFLDEPTASLDAVATQKIKKSLDEIKKGRTVLVISHNIEQIVTADYLYFFNDGEIIAQGGHEELYIGCPQYRELINAHFQVPSIDTHPVDNY